MAQVQQVNLPVEAEVTTRLLDQVLLQNPKAVSIFIWICCWCHGFIFRIRLDHHERIRKVNFHVSAFSNTWM